jgi:hypothetical protein
MAPDILWAAAFGAHTISGRESKFFNALRRHFQSASAGSTRRCDSFVPRRPCGEMHFIETGAGGAL